VIAKPGFIHSLVKGPTQAADEIALGDAVAM
jgi:hypothetical protein